jgi:gluconate 2-dehydrogenase gamma chain
MLSRRDLLRIAGLAGAVGAMPGPAGRAQTRGGGTAAAGAGGAGTQSTLASRGPLLALTAEEADLLDAIVARLIPSDASGPGAKEAEAVRYIDRALAGALAGSRAAYRAGLAALDRYARSSRGAPFTALSPTDQDSLLIDVETGAATGSGFAASSAEFFNMVRTHTWQGTFGDPFYGGNAHFIGWDLLGYPGVRTAVSADEQRLGARLTPTRRSAYDHELFHKATVRRGEPEGGRRGD